MRWGALDSTVAVETALRILDQATLDRVLGRLRRRSGLEVVQLRQLLPGRWRQLMARRAPLPAGR